MNIPARFYRRDFENFNNVSPENGRFCCSSHRRQDDDVQEPKSFDAKSRKLHARAPASVRLPQIKSKWVYLRNY